MTERTWRRGAFGLPFLIVLMTGCTVWQPATTPTPADSAATRRGSVRVTDTAGRAHVGIGYAASEGYLTVTRIDGTADSVPRGAIRSVDLGDVDARRSFALAAVLAGLAVGFVAWLVYGGFNTT